MAGVGTGLFKSLEEATKRMVTIKDRYEPNPANAEIYAENYRKYVGLYDSLVGMFAKE